MKIKTRLFTILIFISLYLWIPLLQQPHRAFSIVKMNMRSSCRVKGDRWIIATETSLKPSDIQEILNKLDWNLMILGRKETSRTWSEQFASSKILYLSFQEQTHSQFESARFIIDDVNAQRNLGNLIAIHCGAKVIYEFDSKNGLWASEIKMYPSTIAPENLPWMAFSVLRSHFVNIYGVFGESEIWPRGLPLTEVQNISEDGWSSVRHNDDETIHPYIQQMLISSNPDIDPVATAIRKRALSHLVFDPSRGPIAVEPFTFCPYNAKDTLYHRQAFWGLYLPVKTDSNQADIWRSFFVQRLLWDIGGHLLFVPADRREQKRARKAKYIHNQQITDTELIDLVQFLYHWRDNANTVPERLVNLISALIGAKLLTESGYAAMRAWLSDLQSIGYQYPRIRHKSENILSENHTKRSAVCVTGLTECVEEVWAKNEKELRSRLRGELDVFLFLSSGDGSTKDISSKTHKYRIRQARLYNATVNIVHIDTHNIDPGFPPTCNYKYPFTRQHKIIPIEHERLAQAKCYNIVRLYEKKKRIRYELLIRARSDSIFTRLPSTFERSGDLNPNYAIIVPDEHHYYGINDRFAIGPIDFMGYYMCRWNQLPLCLTENVHPESFLAFILSRNNVTVVRDTELSLVQIPHSKQQCH